MESKFKEGRLVVVKYDYAHSTPYLKGDVCKIIKGEGVEPFPAILQVISTKEEGGPLFWIKPIDVELYLKEGTKTDGDKLRVDLLDVYAITELAKVLTFGAKKYTSVSLKEVFEKCNQSVIQVNLYTVKADAEVVMKENCGKRTQDMLRGREKMLDNGEKIIQIKLEFMQKNGEKVGIAEKEIKKQNGRITLKKEDLLNNSIKNYHNKDVAYVAKNNISILTMIIKQENLEEFYVVSATTDLDSLTILLNFLKRQSLISKETCLESLSSYKTGARNWEKGIKYSRCYGAALRHLLAWWGGKKVDEETGLSPLVHAMCEIMFLIRYTKDRKEFDDRPGTK